MFIHINKENITYIEELKNQGYKEVQPKIKGLITLTTHEVASNKIFPLYKKIYESTVECKYCNKQYHRNSLGPHIKRKHK